MVLLHCAYFFVRDSNLHPMSYIADLCVKTIYAIFMAISTLYALFTHYKHWSIYQNQIKRINNFRQIKASKTARPRSLAHGLCRCFWFIYGIFAKYAKSRYWLFNWNVFDLWVDCGFGIFNVVKCLLWHILICMIGAIGGWLCFFKWT